jgi:polysaccharide biosynthesis/export protein
MLVKAIHVSLATVAVLPLLAALSLPSLGQNTLPEAQSSSVTTPPTEQKPATQQDAPPAPQALPQEQGVSAPTPTSASAPSESAPTAEQHPEYVLQAGDDIEVHVFNLPELSQKLHIRPDGRISLTLLNEMMAAGTTPSTLGETIRKGYSAHFRNPQVTVVVMSVVNQNVYVGGEVNQPRLIALNGKLSAVSALFYAGGLKSTAKTKEIIILRNSGKNSAQVTRLNLNDVLKKGSPDVELQPFDVVFVPKTRIAQLDQFVDQYLKMLQPIALNLGFSYLLGGQNVQVSIP